MTLAALTAFSHTRRWSRCCVSPEQFNCSVGKFGVRFVPGKAFEVSLKPRLLGEHLAAARINLLPHLDGIFDKQTLEQRARDRLTAEFVVDLLLVGRRWSQRSACRVRSVLHP